MGKRRRPRVPAGLIVQTARHKAIDRMRRKARWEAELDETVTGKAIEERTTPTPKYPMTGCG